MDNKRKITSTTLCQHSEKQCSCSKRTASNAAGLPCPALRPVKKEPPGNSGGAYGAHADRKAAGREVSEESQGQTAGLQISKT